MKFDGSFFELHVIGCILIIAVFLIFVTSISAEGTNIGPNVYPPGSKPFGLTYGEWSAKWWQWAMSIPIKDNPVVDENGEKCAIGQKDANVWFLAGTGGGEVTRSCNIPAEKAIFFPLLNVECDYFSPDLTTEADLRKCAKADQDKATNLQASVDGVAIPDVKIYRAQSPLFNVTIPKDNTMGYPPGITQAISDGFWILLKPLPAGKHTIEFSGSLVDFTSTGPVNFVSDAKYDVTITNP
jgi:hypothetical protein